MKRQISEGGTGKLSEMDPLEGVRYWRSKTPEERIEAIFEIRRFYYEVMHPGTGATRLDRSVGGTRKLRD
ncbi:MAG TPA: hypothetical protein VG820_04220 [Fimbriimonadaceae bacterium]|nr:hypothetical protein [Fimbriimonadaceae bacterium]